MALSLLLSAQAFSEEVPFTLEDRDRLIRVETTLTEFKDSVNQRFESLEKTIDGVEEQIAEKLDGVNKRIDGVERTIAEKLDGVNKRIDGVERTIAEKLDGVNKRIDGVERTIAEKLDGVNQRISGVDKRMDGFDQRLERLETVMMGGFGLIFTSMIGLVGFVLWDRRSALAPAIRRSNELGDESDRIKRALREVAQKDSNVAEALKHVGLL
jgi:uncharacterized protein YoxC